MEIFNTTHFSFLFFYFFFNLSRAQVYQTPPYIFVIY
jgi:hypothetical protein